MNDYTNKILFGDSLTILQSLPANIIDCGVTSPPYNKREKQKGWLVKNVLYENSGDNFPEEQYQCNQVSVLNEIYRITKPGGSFFYNHKLRWDRGDLFHPMDWLRQSHWHVKQEIIWDRMIAANIRGWRYWQVEERIYWLYKPINNNKIGDELLSKHAKLTSVWRGSPERNNPHPAPFPLWLPVRIIASQELSSESLILDPYAGSGTTAVAAKLLGLNYIGIEMSENYIKQAEKRLTMSQSEIYEFEKEMAIHKVEKSFRDRKADGDNTGKHRKICDYQLQPQELL